MGRRLYKRKCAYCLQEVTFYHGEKKEKCPHCGKGKNGNYIKPKTETKLFELQYYYLESHDKKYLNEMSKILLNYAVSNTKKFLNGKYIMDNNELIDLSQEAVSLFIIDYLKNENFYVHHSFAGLLRKKLQQLCYNTSKKRHDAMDSLNVLIDKENHIELEELQNYSSLWNYNNEDYLFFDMDMKHLLDAISNTVQYTYKLIKKNRSKLEALITVRGVYYAILYPKKCSKYYDEYGQKIKNNVDAILYAIKSLITNEDI